MGLQSATLSALTLIAVLFALAAVVEQWSKALSANPRRRNLAYSCALSVYCSSWTFYGAVGSAIRES